MVPINEVFIAKVVLGYLSSRNLVSTAECFVKESEGLNCNDSGKCEKERILNHLEGMNLLPSLEEILGDYFAYQGPDDDVPTDKIYMLWKQLDVVVGQLRAITLGKSKTKAFMCSRNDPKSYSKLVEKNDCNPNSVSHQLFSSDYPTHSFREVNGAQMMQKVPYKMLDAENSLLFPIQTTEPCESIKENIAKSFKSPRRKRRPPRKNVISNPIDVFRINNQNTAVKSVDVTAHNQIKDEFSEMVAALISNDSLPSKLADKINQVVSIDPPKVSLKENNDLVDEVLRVTADDPDLNILFSILGGYHQDIESANDSYLPANSFIQPINKQPYVNNEMISIGENFDVHTNISSGDHGTNQLGVPISKSNLSELQLDVSCVSHNDHCGLNLQTVMAPTFSSLIDMISPINTCPNRSLPEFSSSIYSHEKEILDCTTDIQATSKKQLILPCHSETLQNLIESKSSDVLSIGSTADHSSSVDLPGSLPKPLISELTKISKYHDKEGTTDKCNSVNVRVKDSEILASHALLQLSTSPLKLKPSPNFKSKIAKEFSSTMTISNGNIDKHPICSTNVFINDVSARELVQKDIFVKEGVIAADTVVNIPQVTIDDVRVTQPILSDVEVVLEDKNNSRCLKKKRKKSKIKAVVLKALAENTSSCNKNIEGSCKKTRKSKDVVVTQLGFYPENISFDGCNKTENNIGTLEDGTKQTFVEAGNPLFATSALSQSTSLVINISPKIIVTDECETNSPASLLHAKLNFLDPKPHLDTELSESIHFGNSVGITKDSANCASTKTSGEFQTFRIKGNDISKLCQPECSSSSQPNAIESKMISKVISNTDSLSKVAGDINIIVSDTFHAKNSKISNDSLNSGRSTNHPEKVDISCTSHINIDKTECQLPNDDNIFQIEDGKCDNVPKCTPDNLSAMLQLGKPPKKDPCFIEDASESDTLKPNNICEKSNTASKTVKLASNFSSRNKGKKKMTVKFRFKSPKKKKDTGISATRRSRERQSEKQEFAVGYDSETSVLNLTAENAENFLEDTKEIISFSGNQSISHVNQEDIVSKSYLSDLKSSCCKVASDEKISVSNTGIPSVVPLSRSENTVMNNQSKVLPSNSPTIQNHGPINLETNADNSIIRQKRKRRRKFNKLVRDIDVEKLLSSIDYS